MYFHAYVEDQKRLYAAFAETVAAIIDAALSARTEIPSPLLTTHRAKAEESLRSKLEARQLLQSASIESHIKDLAGCRLVFYTDSDRDAFLRSGLAFDNFSVDHVHPEIDHQAPVASQSLIHRPDLDAKPALSRLLRSRSTYQLQ